MTDVELDERVTALEENGGGGNAVNGKTRKLYQINQGLKQVDELKYITVMILYKHLYKSDFSIDRQKYCLNKKCSCSYC